VSGKLPSPARSRRRRNAVASAGGSRGRVVIRWRRLPGSQLEVEQAARDVAETVLGEMQRRLDAPRLTGPAAPRLHAQGRGTVAQADAPLTYVLDEELVVGWQWSEREGALQLVTETGRVINGKAVTRDEPRCKVGAMERIDEQTRPRRKPARVNVRPGAGGRKPADRFEQIIDPTEGLGAYGELIPQAASGGASILLLELDPSGNAAILCRLSSEEEQEQFLLQLKPCLALAKRFPDELRPRYALFALNMSGTREVRPERAGPPPPGQLERDDMLIVDRWLGEGWLEHIVARGGDRLAREMLPAETLLGRWGKAGVGLWLARHGRRMDYRADRLALRAEMMVSAEERAWLTSRMLSAQIEKGPLAGRGWLGSAPFGFIYDRKTRTRHQDPEQWRYILRAFELADSGDYVDDNGLSTRKVTERLAEEGCPFDHDRVRTILKDIVYVTGEYVATVRGIPVPQTPIPVENPVALDRFLRVQDLLALRQGPTSRTPLGEFLFNYVPFTHKRCAGQKVGVEERPAQIRGYVENKKGMVDTRRYRHSPAVPGCCQRGNGPGYRGSYTWARDDLERPAVEAIREVAQHPEVLRQLALAERHRLAESPGSGRLTDGQRAQIEHEIVELESQRDSAVDQWVTQRGRPDAPTLDDYERLMNGFRRRLETLERQLDRDAEAELAEATGTDGTRPDRVSTFLEIMTIETPDDPRLKALRARLFQRIVSAVEVAELEDGAIEVTLYGHLVPGGTSLDACDPIAASADLLDSYELTKNGGIPAAERQLAAIERVRSETDLDGQASKSVSELFLDLFSLPGAQARMRAEREALEHTGWHKGPHAPWFGDASWRLAVRLAAPSSGAS
jgi:hypothetical protein